jgi:hypothetical protein
MPTLNQIYDGTTLHNIVDPSCIRLYSHKSPYATILLHNFFNTTHETILWLKHETIDMKLTRKVNLGFSSQASSKNSLATYASFFNIWSHDKCIGGLALKQVNAFSFKG